MLFIILFCDTLLLILDKLSLRFDNESCINLQLSINFRDIANCIKAAVLGITESKLDSSVTNMRVNINGYRIIRNDRNRHGGGVACYVKNDLCFNTKKIFPNSIEHVFFEILIQKLNPLRLEYFIDLQIPMIFKFTL